MSAIAVHPSFSDYANLTLLRREEEGKEEEEKGKEEVRELEEKEGKNVKTVTWHLGRLRRTKKKRENTWSFKRYKIDVKRLTHDYES